MPRVSVLMAVHNGARYLREAIDSILAQTFSDLEFLIVDDGSTDTTAVILDGYADPRIIRLHNEENLGLAKSMNRALTVAKGEYIARQDADDRSLPQRLMHQVRFLDGHPSISLVGTGFVEIDEQGQERCTVVMPVDPGQIHEMLFYAHCFCHGSVMGRRADLQAVGGYDERYAVAQDTDLCLRLAERGQLSNLPAPLYGFRMHAASITGRSRTLQRQMGHQATDEAMARCLSHPDGWRPSDLTLGRFHFGQAMQALEDGRTERAHEHLVRAGDGNRRLDDDADYLVRMAVRRAFELGPAGRSRSKSSQDVATGLRFLHSLFALLPNDLRLIPAKRRWAAGELHAAYAFAAFEAGNRIKTVQHCLTTWCHDPRRLKHLGLLSVFVRSLVGSRLGRGHS
jgi:glycosyltransferase involved in cell wall biosynthesis